MVISYVGAKIAAHSIVASLMSDSNRRDGWKWDIRCDLADLLGHGAPAATVEMMRSAQGLLMRVYAEFPYQPVIDVIKGFSGRVKLTVCGVHTVELPVKSVTVMDEHGTFLTRLDI